MKHERQELRKLDETTDNRIRIVSDETLTKGSYWSLYTIRSTSKGKCITVKGNRYYLHDIKQWDGVYADIKWYEPNEMN